MTATRLVVVGFGYWGPNLARNIAARDDAELIAICDPHPDRRAAAAVAHPGIPLVDDYDALLRHAGVDGIVLATPAATHHELGMAALEAGKHLFVEKPLALDLAEADRLVERGRSHPGAALVGFNLRYHSHVRAARAAIAAGALGRIDFVRSVASSRFRLANGLPAWRRSREHGGGVLAEVGVHHFDLWRYLLRGEVVEIAATSVSDEIDDRVAAVTARMSSGVLASAALSQSGAEGNAIEVYGSEGSLRVSIYQFDGFELLPARVFPGGLESRLRAASTTVRNLPGAVARALRGGGLLDTYRAEWEHFLDCARRGARPACDLEEGRRVVAVTVAAVESARLGRPVRLEPEA